MLMILLMRSLPMHFYEIVVGIFWSEARKLHRSNVSVSTIVDGISTADGIAELFASKYQSLYTSVFYDRFEMESIHCLVHKSLGFERYRYWGIGYWPILAGIGWYWYWPNTFFSNHAQYWADNSLRRRLATNDDLISRNSLSSRQLPHCKKPCALCAWYIEA